ncbi:MAG TPA: hypothetical protein ENI23_05825 [bacterium]|nr:hypothetical protein [bacterium]
MTRYSVRYEKRFIRRLKRLTKKDRWLRLRSRDILLRISDNPFRISLRTHKVNTRFLGKAYSSRVTANLRITWRFVKDNPEEIIILDIGGHEGKHKVYK